MSPLITLFLVTTVALCTVEAERNALCYQPMEPGRCYDGLQSYYFHADSKECREFTYGGCMGNENRFESMKECEETCEVWRCKQHKDPGLCKASLKRYYFDNGQCKSFTFGGCGGNSNNFRSLKQCGVACFMS